MEVWFYVFLVLIFNNKCFCWTQILTDGTDKYLTNRREKIGQIGQSKIGQIGQSINLKELKRIIEKAKNI